MSEKRQTLEQVLIDLILYGCDRAALVRPAQEGKRPAVCVIMVENRALKQLGSQLLPIMRELGGERDFGAPIITETIGLGPLFEIADKAPTGWCWASFTYGKIDITLAIFSRELDRVAAICNENGAPCSIDPQKPAEGYSIDRRIDRSNK
jgi:hypothetical protein